MTTSTYVRGRGLALARAFWLAIVLLTLCLSVAAVPSRHTQLRTVCAPPNCAELQLAPAEAIALQRAGFSIDAYATYEMVNEGVFPLIFFMVGMVIFWRRSDDWMAIFASITLVTWGAAEPPVIEALATMHPAWRLPASLVQDMAWFCLVTIFYLFPNGRFVPAWTRLCALLWAVWNIVRPFFLQSTPFRPGKLEVVPMVGLLAIGLAAQIYRYARVSSAEQRQQTKWVVSALTLAALGIFVYVPLYRSLQPGFARVLLYSVGIPALIAGPGALVPLAIGVAILRYKLWDIDLIINRALVYAVITAVLALLYISSILFLQSAFRALTGQSSPLAVVGSTLAIAAVFQPLRTRVQTGVDRRFYRRKYDAVRTLEAFSLSLRDEVDLGTLLTSLMSVVEETMQPEHVSIWLRDPAATGRR